MFRFSAWYMPLLNAYVGVQVVVGLTPGYYKITSGQAISHDV